jgi:hypothetical protein
MLHMMQCPYTYVATNALCCKCFMSRRDKGAQAKVVPSGAAVPACARKQIKVGTEHKAVSMGTTAGVEPEAASMGRQQARSTKLHL